VAVHVTRATSALPRPLALPTTTPRSYATAALLHGLLGFRLIISGSCREKGHEGRGKFSSVTRFYSPKILVVRCRESDLSAVGFGLPWLIARMPNHKGTRFRHRRIAYVLTTAHTHSKALPSNTHLLLSSRHSVVISKEPHFPIKPLTIDQPPARTPFDNRGGRPAEICRILIRLSRKR